MPYSKIHKKSRFQSRKPVHTFHDLEVYERASQLAAGIITKLIPALGIDSGQDKIKNQALVWLKEKLSETCFKIPELIAEAHSRKLERNIALETLDEAMWECNKAVVYLEEIEDVFCQELENKAVCKDLIKRYILARKKMFNLYKAWSGFDLKTKHAQDNK